MPRAYRRSRHASPAALFVFTLLVLSPVQASSSSSGSSAIASDIPPTPSTSTSIYTLQDQSQRSLRYRSGDANERRAKKPEYVAHPAGELVCRPFGVCEPCPEDERHQPFCMPFGNRRLLHCVPASTHKVAGAEPIGEVPAWEACGKVVKRETQDYWEFVTANLLFLIVALCIYWARTSVLATAQYRQLAARIGIPGAGWRA